MGSILHLYDNIISNPVYRYGVAKKEICSYNTFSNSFKLLFEPTDKTPKAIGYLKEGKIIDNYNKLKECYYLLQGFSTFKLIPIETLQVLMELYVDNIIKVYVVLLNWYEFKQKTNEKYNFTKEHLAAAIGYTSHWYYDEIDIILRKLDQANLIVYHIEKIFINGKYTYNHILDKVNIYPPKQAYSEW